MSLLTSTRLARLALAFGLLAGLAFSTALPAAAIAHAAGSVAAESSAPTTIILDASGSMLTEDAPGSRIAAAKVAVDGLVRSLPADAQLGLEVYGTSTSSAESAKAAGCQDITTLVPVGPIDRSSFLAKVASVRASGYTPIGNALRKAAAALPKEGARSIVLVSDGEDTCAPPQPCDVARELHQQGIGLTVNTVGFKVDAQARQQLQCIAGATGGSYVDAPDGPTLSTRLQAQVQRALQGYRVAGTPITGSKIAGDAPQLQPGQYVDSYAKASSGVTRADGTTKYYSLTLTQGQTPYLSATMVPPARSPKLLDSVGVRASINQGGEQGCRVSGSLAFSPSILGLVSPQTSIAAPGAVGSDSSCLKPGPATLELSRSGDAYAGDPMKMEIAYRLEPPANDSGLPAAATKTLPVARVDASGSASAITSGTSFNDAPLVGPGVYRDSFVTGETRFVRVHVGWGQRLAFSITPTKLPNRSRLDAVPAQVFIASPLRQTLDAPQGASISDAFAGADGNAMYSSMSVPVRYKNRSSSTADIAAQSLSGDYYIQLTTGFQADPYTDSYVLRVGLVGKTTPGPRYLTPAASSSPSPSTPASSTGSSTDASRSTSPSPAAAAHDSGGISTPVVVGGVVGAAVLIALAIAVALRRRSSVGQARSHT